MINREYVKKKVAEAIEQLPSEAIVIREVNNRYKEKAGYCNVANLRGVLYNNSSQKTFGISLSDTGVSTSSNNKNYLVVYDEVSEVVKATDIISIEGKVYKVADPGENLKIFCLMQLEEYDRLKIADNTVIEDESIYPLLQLPLGVEFVMEV